ncbi:MAG: hypothetical protein RBU37_24885 [Myxococcota bacterium]|nr:hypothetical protein [Myxococcota bacterium]
MMHESVRRRCPVIPSRGLACERIVQQSHQFVRSTSQFLAEIIALLLCSEEIFGNPQTRHEIDLLAVDVSQAAPQLTNDFVDILGERANVLFPLVGPEGKLHSIDGDTHRARVRQGRAPTDIERFVPMEEPARPWEELIGA